MFISFSLYSFVCQFGNALMCGAKTPGQQELEDPGPARGGSGQSTSLFGSHFHYCATMFAHGGMTDFTPTLEPPQNDIGSLFGQSVLLQPVGKNTIHNRLFFSSKIRHIATNMLFL